MKNWNLLKKRIRYPDICYFQEILWKVNTDWQHSTGWATSRCFIFIMNSPEVFGLGLPKITNYFLAFNHQNYVRWLVLFHDNLLKLKFTHPEVHKKFKNECLLWKRTKKLFSRLPVDLKLEQAINADASR